MKKLSISIVATVVLFFCTSFVQAQNQSDQNSNVITFHQTYPLTETWGCPEYGSITFAIEVHQVMKLKSDGTLQYHANAKGEGVDEHGDFWTFHQAWVGSPNIKNVRSLTLQGPKGAKLKLRVLFVRNGQGEIVRHEIDPICE